MESTFTDTIQKQLDDSRRELIDLSTRNRLISIPIGSKSARLIQVFDEKAEEVYKRLITDKKTFTFLPGQGRSESPKQKQIDIDGTKSDDDEQFVDLPLPDDDTDPATGKAKRHVDSRLQTRLSPEVLQRRLFDLHNEARTIIEEQGVNILYLAIGYLKWTDQSNANTERVAPLLLVPIDLIRQSISDRFAIKWREEDLQDNLSLAEKLNIEYGVTLPLVNTADNDSFDLEAYFTNVEQAIKTMPGWSVERDSMCVGFFSFAKFLMYKDLDINTWPQTSSPLQHSLIRKFLNPNSEPFGVEQASSWNDQQRLDERIPVERLDHVVDADSSQTIAVELVREGKNLVIQGPPGTGKSQTITNIIATAVLDGKKVLFLAEKLAALEVVKSRLEKEGLGVLCLELHSNKARKSAVAEELKATWELGCPQPGALAGLNDSLARQRIALNEHVDRLHATNLIEQSAFEQVSVLSYHGLPQGEENYINFTEAEKWTRKEIEGFKLHLQELVTRLEVIGNLSNHPWRGSTLTHYTGLERQRIEDILVKLLNSLETQNVVASRIAQAYGQDASTLTHSKVSQLQTVAQLAGERPVNRLESIGSSIWEEAPKAIVSLAKTKQLFEQITADLHEQVQQRVWQNDWTQACQQLEQHGLKWYKFLLGDYRSAMKQLSADLKTALPSSYDQRLALVKQVIEGQQAFQSLQAKQTLGLQVFGGLWEEEGVGKKLVDIADWMEQLITSKLEASDRKKVLLAEQNQMRYDADQLTQQIDAYQTAWQSLKETLLLSYEHYIGGEEESDVLLFQWKEVITTWKDSLDQLSDWAAWQNELQKAKGTAIGPLAELIEQGKITATQARSSFQRIVAHQQLGHIFQQDSELANFNGAIHNQKVIDFQQMDRRRLDLAKVNVLTKHYQQLPPKLPVGAVGTVLGEVNKQRSHRPIRQLLNQAGPVVQELKPVFMMSPLSVAQFLEPGKVEFDLLVIDEASQVKPVDALGAIARCRQVVVVGDDKQLPPSNFFSKLTSNDGGQDSDEEDTDAGLVKAKEMESILSLAKARGLTDTLLRWHYRSKHHSLITVSNQRYYENKLYVVPSPWKQNAGLGLVWRPVQGVYDRSNTRANAIEAREVAQAVIKHAIDHSDQTLGVAAFSMAQQRAIQDEVERLRRQNPQCEEFFSKYPHEPFFVKNLENVQGDERDVIYLSVGYGRDNNGKLSMNFGPLNRQGGERRLNVLISRARKRCEVFSSITDQDIELTANTGEGVAGLKQFLQYTRTGHLEVARQSERSMDSPFEEAVKAALEAKFGWEVHTQVGVAGFFIDLAIVDPERKGRYVIGIECDGVAYHSSPSARERDRLRQSILESQGWVIHRLWGIDFFRKKEQELTKIKAAYDEALSLLMESDRIAIVKPEEEKNVFHLTRTKEEIPAFAIPYAAAPTRLVPDPDPYTLYPSQVSKMVHEILEVEAPIHFDELTTRMREQWGWTKAGEKFRSLVAQGVEVLQKDQVIHQEGSFISIKDAPVNVRIRDEKAPIGTRKIANIPPAEIDLSLLHVTRLARLLTREEAAKEVSMLLGFKALSAEFRTIINDRIDHLIQQKALLENEGSLTLRA